MSISKSDLRHLKWGLLAVLVAFVLGGTTLLFSQSQLTRVKQEQLAAQHRLSDAQHQLADARNRLIAAQDDEKNRAAYAKEYASLADRKIIGGEQRLDWIEGLDNLRRQNRVLNFTYTIGPQRPYAPVPPLDSGSFDLNLSPTTLQLDLLHEAQLVDFFDALRSSVNGSFIVERCSLVRSGAAFEDAGTPQLKAECSGGWITLKKRSEK